MAIHWLDGFILFILFCTIYWGWKEGLTGEVFRFLSVVAALFFAFKFTHVLSSEIATFVRLPYFFLKLFSFFVILIFTYVLVQGVKLATQKYGESTNFYDRLERYGGLCVGFLKGMIVVFMFLALLGTLESPKLSAHIKYRTFLASWMVLQMPRFFDYMAGSWRGRRVLILRKYFNDMANRVQNPPMRHF
ncbi:hypothetical protein AB834_06155 [PVC group bacterium (ex Bugula neritina AB1)]|nr:hypothetical protein AB834_06155 [PVC group bacterium (ex Bugula neritina AB1)]